MAAGSGPILVTGASGFIGRALVQRLVDDGRTVVCTARRPVAGTADDVAADDVVRGADGAVSWVVGDLADAEFVDRLVHEVRPRVVFHLASRVTGSRSLDVVPATLTDNLVASINVLRAVTDAGCERVVLTGSGDEPRGDEAPCSPYAATKWAVGGYARMFHLLYGTPVVTARPFMVYGPDRPDSSRVIPYVTTTLLGGEAPLVTSGRRLCDWVHVDDVVDALLVVATDPACIGRVLDIGTGRLETVRHVVEVVRSLVGGDVEPVFGGMPDRPFESEAVADVAETEHVCGWTASIPLDDGLERTVAWYAGRARRSAST
jgi:nucleoside-diphosphate-sugar epimerase